MLLSFHIDRVYPNNSLITQMTITIMTNATTTCSAIKPSISNMSNIIKSVANIQHTIHIRSAIAAILITYDKHPLIIVCFSAFKLIICHPKNYSETRTAASLISPHRHRCNGQLWQKPRDSINYLTLFLSIAL